MRELAATWMRGGTSKCWVFDRADLDALGADTAAVLLRAFGSPDPRQVDGVGGGTSTTSKAVILTPSGAGDADVDYTFAQVGIRDAVVDWGSNCGNCSAVVGLYALRRGWVRAYYADSENNRKARFYEITREGRQQLEAQVAEWEQSSRAVNRILRFATQGA